MAQVQAQLQTLAGSFNHQVDIELDKMLQALIDEMKPVTPVLTGDMQQGYGLDPTATGVELTNEMDYAEWVIGGTIDGRMTPNHDLNLLLDSAEVLIESELNLAVTRIVRDLG